MRVTTALLFLVLQFCLLSCSSLTFKSKGAIFVGIGHNEEVDTVFEIHSQRDFYLWGLYPTDHEVLVDIELANMGASQATILKFGLDSEKYWSSLFYQVITFGMYHPVYYMILAKGRKTHE